jgi:hypothetical protein
MIGIGIRLFRLYLVKGAANVLVDELGDSASVP